MQNFLIEFRLHGYAKHYAKSLAYEISKIFHVKGVTGHRVVPHITLYGPATTNDIRHVISTVQRVGQKYTFVSFRVKGFGCYTESKVIYLDIEPSQELRALRQELSDALQKISSCQPFDKTQEFGFHSTIAFKDLGNKFNPIWNYIKQKEEPNIKQHLLRITILGHNRRILYEYDLVLRRLFNRRQALSGYWRRRTMNRLIELQGLHKQKRQSRFARFLQLFRKKDHEMIYFIGDLHLDHANIIRYCHRPFSDLREMNGVLINNWNNVIKADDTVYFLGDLAFGRNSRPTSYWRKHLPGKITFISGSHDQGIRKTKETLKHGKYTFVLLHDPDQMAQETPKENTWIIHGHKHNNDIENYPFINGEKQTINVSVEVIDYKPISLDFLLSLDLDSIMRMDTINSKPEKWKH